MGEKKKSKKIIVISIISVIALILILVLILVQENRSKLTDSDIKKVEDVKAFSSSNEFLGTTEENKTCVSGTITNLTNNVYRDVTVECILYGEDGEELEKLYGETYFLGANESCKFIAVSQNNIKYSKVKNYAVSNIKGNVLEKDINITNDFLIYDESIGLLRSLFDKSPTKPSVSYKAKNVNNTDYKEPITIVSTIENNRGEKYVIYNVLNGLKPNAIETIYGGNSIGEELPKSTEEISYSFKNHFAILGNIAEMENMKGVMVIFSRVVATQWEEAKKELDTMGLKVEKIEQPHKTPKGNVFKQEPEIGTKLKAGSTVKIYVSTGEE